MNENNFILPYKIIYATNQNPLEIEFCSINSLTNIKKQFPGSVDNNNHLNGWTCHLLVILINILFLYTI